MSDHTQPASGWADLTHASRVHAVGAAYLPDIGAPDGGATYVLTLVGMCRCRQDDAEIERTFLLRDIDLVNVIAALTDVARATDLGDTLADRVETIIEATRERLGHDPAGELLIVCNRCGQQICDCDCDHLWQRDLFDKEKP